MKEDSYFKIIISYPRRDIFSFLQNNILFRNIQMFYLPQLEEVETFVKNIKPELILLYIDRDALINPDSRKFLNTSVLEDVWKVFILSSKISFEQFRELGEFRHAFVLPETTSYQVITSNIRTIIEHIQQQQQEKQEVAYKENLLRCSYIIQHENNLKSLFERLTQILPKMLPYDYWAIFSFDAENSQVTHFTQFIPPHRRNVAILTPRLEEMARGWVQTRKSLRLSREDDPALFRKLWEWGWEVRQLILTPIVHESIVVGGLLLVDTRERIVYTSHLEFIQQLSNLLKDRIYDLMFSRRSGEEFDRFAEQLLDERLSEERIIQLTCQELNQIARAEKTIFWQISRGFGLLFPKYVYGVGAQEGSASNERFMLYLTRDSHLNQLVSGEEIRLISDLPSQNSFDPTTVSAFQRLNYHHILVAPVRVAQEELGAFIISRRTEAPPFGDWEKELVRNLLSRVQKVLTDARIVKEAQVKLKQLARIFELGNEIKLDLNLEEILNRISHSIRRTLGWNDVAILRSEPFQRRFKLVNKMGFDQRKELPFDIEKPVGAKKLEKFLLNCRRISHSYFYDSSPLSGNGTLANLEEDTITEWNEADLLIVPIETRKKIMGYLLVQDPVDRLKPSEDKVVALEYFANQAAVAMENSLLYENLRTSEERYRTLAETMSLALVTCTSRGNIIYLNPAFERLVGLERKALLKQPLHKFFSSESQTRLQEIVKQVLTRGSKGNPVENVELELISTSGETIPVSTFVFPFYRQRHRIGYFLVLNDLRVIKKLERLKADFNSMIVHDLRSPMNVIQGFIELIRSGVVGEINAEQEELLDIAKENVKKVLTLIDNFLVASKMEVGRFSIEPKVGEINSLIERIEEGHQILAKNKNITLKTELNRNLPLLYFDSLRIEQVINNLLSNALKFTPEGGEIRITSEFYRKEIKGEEKMFVRVGVHDTGPGIPPEKQKTVFDKYEQVDSEMYLKSAGTGLGLSICKEIVHLHGGDIWVESELGKGSHFYFTLPIEPSIDKYLK